MAKPFIFPMSESKSHKFAGYEAMPVTTKVSNAKQSIIQTKVNDFFKKPETRISSVAVIPSTSVSSNHNPLLERNNRDSIDSDVEEEIQIFSSKAHQSPKTLCRRSQLYEFDESFIDSQLFAVNTERTPKVIRPLRLTTRPESIRKCDLPTQIAAKVLNAKKNGDDFVSAKMIFGSEQRNRSFSSDESDDDIFGSSFSFIQNDREAPSLNITDCIENSKYVMPQNRRRLEESISKILNCNVSAINLNRNYRNEFELDSGKAEETPNGVNMNKLTISQQSEPTQPPTPEESAHVEFFDGDVSEWPFSPDVSTGSGHNESPMLERKKFKHNHESNIDCDNSITANVSNSLNDSSQFNPTHPHRCIATDEFASVAKYIPSPHSLNDVPHMDKSGQDSRALEMFWSSQEESSDISTEQKVSCIGELLAHHKTPENGDPKNQMRKPNGRNIQARIKRPSSVRSQIVNESWASSYVEQNRSREVRNHDFIRRNILRLQKHDVTEQLKTSVDADEEECSGW